MSQRRPSRTYALVVGIEKYDAGPEWNTLDGPANDACLFAAWLRQRGVPAENIFLFLSPLEKNGGVTPPQGVPAALATSSNIHESISTLSSIDQGDLLYVFWGGHGVAEPDKTRRLFCADATKREKRNLNLTSLIDALRTEYFSSLRHQIFIIDACAQLVDPLTQAAQFPDTQFSKGRKAHNCQQRVLFAAAQGGLAKNLTERKTGLFSSVVLDVLRQQADDLWPPDMSTVIDNVQEQFNRLAVDERRIQTPVFLSFEDSSGNASSYTVYPQKGLGATLSIPQINYLLSEHELDQLVELLVQCPSLIDQPSRRFVLAQLSDILGKWLVEPTDNVKADIQIIGMSCNGSRSGLTRLMSTLWRIEGNDYLRSTIAQFFEGIACQKLDTICKQIKWSYDVLLTAYKATVDFPFRSWFHREQGTTSLFSHIVEQLVADKVPGQHGLPPLLEFVERLVLSISDGTAQHQLRLWVDEAASTLGITEEVVARARTALTKREDVSRRQKIYLLIKVAPSLSLVPDQFSVQAWRFDETGHVEPVTGGEDNIYSAITREALPPVCDRLRQIIENSMIEDDELHVEIFLPHDLLTEAVDQWTFKQGKTTFPVGKKYPLAVRSWDRVYEQDYRDTWLLWRKKWQIARSLAAPTSAQGVVWVSATEVCMEETLKIVLGQNSALCCALTCLLSETSEAQVAVVLETALSMGVPILLWPRQFKGTLEELHQRVEAHVARPLLELPGQIQQARSDPARSMNVMLLWDDPNRLPPDAPANKYPPPNLAVPH